MDEARAGVAAILGTDVGAVGLTHSTTDAMNAATLLPDWRPGGRVVTTRARTPGRRRAALRPAGSATGSRSAFVEAGDRWRRRPGPWPRSRPPSRPTPGWSRSRTSCGRRGRSCRSHAIAEIAHDRGALVVVDGAQAAGAIPFRFDELGADLYALPAQKWLLGPEGMGALVVDPGRDRRVSPALGGWLQLRATRTAPATPPGGPTAGASRPSGYHRPSVVGMARSIGWLSMYVGLDFVHRRGATLAAASAARLASIPGVSVLTPPTRWRRS